MWLFLRNFLADFRESGRQKFTQKVHHPRSDRTGNCRKVEHIRKVLWGTRGSRNVAIIVEAAELTPTYFEVVDRGYEDFREFHTSRYLGE